MISTKLGKQPGKRKTEKELKKLEQEQKREKGGTDATLQSMATFQQRQKQLGSPAIVIQQGNKRFLFIFFIYEFFILFIFLFFFFFSFVPAAVSLSEIQKKPEQKKKKNANTNTNNNNDQQ